MKETKGGNLEKGGNLWYMKEGEKRHGNVSYIRRTVFVFRMWEDEFPWNLGCSIRNCLFFLWFRRASCEKYSIRGGMEGRIEERIEKVGRWFSSEISFLSNTEDRISLFYIVQLFEIENVRNLFFSVINDSAFHWKHLYIDDAVRHSY